VTRCRPSIFGPETESKLARSAANVFEIKRLVCKISRGVSRSNGLICKITAEDFDIKPSDLQDLPAEVRDQMV